MSVVVVAAAAAVVVMIIVMIMMTDGRCKDNGSDGVVGYDSLLVQAGLNFTPVHF